MADAALFSSGRRKPEDIYIYNSIYGLGPSNIRDCDGVIQILKTRGHVELCRDHDPALKQDCGREVDEWVRLYRAMPPGKAEDEPFVIGAEL